MTANSAKGESAGFDPSKSDLVPIWLVNDDTSQLMIQERVLGRGVFSVRCFSSPLEAVAAARQENSPRFLVTDTNMPGMNGLELAQFWCELHSDPKVLMLSASTLTSEQSRELEQLPAALVRLLSSYRIGELHAQAQEWFLPEQVQEVKSPESALPTSQPLQGAEASAYDEVVWGKLLTLGGAAFLTRALQRFATNGTTKLQQMEQAAARADWPTIHACAHSLKGSAGLVGANELLQACDRLEDLTSPEGQATEPQKREALDRLQSTWQTCLAALPPGTANESAG